MNRAAPAADTGHGSAAAHWWRGRSWRARRGLLRSLLIYYAAPHKIHRLAALFRPWVDSGALCFDVGAHVGDRTRALRRLGARVVAVEPQPACLAFLHWLYRKDSAVTIVPAAVGETEGEATLLVSPRTPTVSSVSPTWVESVRRAPRFAGVTWDEQTSVPVTTLDRLIERFGRPAFCKIDVEGSELSALRGLTEPIPVIVFEYIPAQRQAALACLARLETLGKYEYNWTEREVPRLRSSRWLSPGALASLIEGLPVEGHSGDVYARLREAVVSGSWSVTRQEQSEGAYSIARATDQ